MNRLLLRASAAAFAALALTVSAQENSGKKSPSSLDCSVEIQAPSGFPAFTPSLWGMAVLSPTNSGSISVRLKNRSRQAIDGIAFCSFELVAKEGVGKKSVCEIEVPKSKYPKSPIEFLTLSSGKMVMADARPKTQIHLEPGQEVNEIFSVSKLFWEGPMLSSARDETLFERMPNGPYRLKCVVRLTDGNTQSQDVGSNEAYVLVSGSKKK